MLANVCGFIALCALAVLTALIVHLLMRKSLRAPVGPGVRHED